MRVLCMISQLPAKTGSGTYVSALIREGKRQGHEMGILYGMNLGDGISMDGVSYELPVIFNGVDFTFPVCGMSDVMPYPSKRFDALTQEEYAQYKEVWFLRIQQAVQEFRPDAIFSNHYFILSSLIRGAVPNIKLALLAHGTDLRQLHKDLFFKEDVIRGIRQADIFFSLGKTDAKEISKLFSIPIEEITPIGGGYDSEVFFPSNTRELERPIELVYAGKLSYEKGVQSLLKAFDKIKRQQQVKLTLVGSGSGEEESSIRRLSELVGDVRLVGQLSLRQVGEVFRKSDIFILPSFYEGLGLTCIEALASGLYVVSSEIPALMDLMKGVPDENGDILFVPHPHKKDYFEITKEELNQFEHALADRILIQIEKVRAGRFSSIATMEYVKKFSWECIYQKISDQLLEKIK